MLLKKYALIRVKIWAIKWLIAKGDARAWYLRRKIWWLEALPRSVYLSPRNHRVFAEVVRFVFAKPKSHFW